jgi:hypothetical protein
MIEFLAEPVRDVVLLRGSGKLTDEDYAELIPRLEGIIAREGGIYLYIELRDFRGWEPHAAWEDLKFSIKHGRDLKRLALVGDKKWEAWMVKLARLFTRGEVCYFDIAERDAALRWIHDRSGTGELV